ncbi:hypothetical protein K438DRAFT_2062281 [Mycena galopus ATCC 62051]|nr:hypothetical protein K438DRAFT_2062281 [Mycena galopus ATCC 62051]
MPLLSDSTTGSAGSETRFRLIVGQPPPFQYLSRSHFPHGPMPAVALNTQGPVAAVVEAVSRAWQQIDRREPMALSPTSSSSLQSVYYGQTALPDGQVLHRSASMNTFRVFQDQDTGLPVTMTGHEFTFHLACPEDQRTLWNLEAPYPTDAQIQDVMRRFVPPMVGGAIALSFSMHGTEETPLMLPIEARLRLDKGPAGRGSAADVLRNKLTTVSPDQLNTTNLAKLPHGLAMPMPRGLMGSEREAHRAIADFEEQLYRRASKKLRLDNDIFETYRVEENEDASTTDTESGMPELVSMTSGGERASTSIDGGLCDLCLASQHESELACPVFGASIDEEDRGMGHLLNVLTGDVEATAEGAGRRVSLNTDNEGRHVAGAGAREARYIPNGSALTRGEEGFRSLVDAAVDARRSLAESTVGCDEGAGRKESRSIVQEDADQTGSGHSDDGSPVLRRRMSAPLSYTDRIALPTFSKRGRVVTRDHWSSSPASLPGRPLHSITDNKHTVPAERIETLAPNEWSPAASEEAWGWPSSYPPSYATDSLDPSSTSSESRSEFSCTSRYEFYDDNNFELHESLSFWVRDGSEHQRDHRRFENEMGVEPFHQALQTLHGPLSFFVDYLAMVGQGVKDLVSTAFAPSPNHASVFPVDSDIETTEPASGASPGPTAIHTSLDLTLPAERPTASPTLADSAVSDGEWEEVVVEPLGAGTRKCKHPDGEEGGLNQQGRRKRTRKFCGDHLRRTVIKREARKAAGMADERAVRLMAGVRLAVLEALQRVEDMVWHRYGITEVRLQPLFKMSNDPFRKFRHQFAFPDKLIRHPFLHPLEAAKLQVLWHILQRNGRDNLADAVHEILSIRLHKDYAVSAFFNAASLDESYPERDWDYWHLLGKEYPQSLYLRNYDINSSDSGSMGGLEYPLSENDIAPGSIDNGAGPGHHEPCRDLNGAGPITLTITLREDTTLAE